MTVTRKPSGAWWCEVVIVELVAREPVLAAEEEQDLVHRGMRHRTVSPMELLSGLRVVEGSAFVAAPLGGLTLAQLGADVIRFDTIGGGLDYKRWPVTDDGVSLYWAGLNKGKRSIAIDLSRPEGRELATELITAPGDNAGLFLSNFPESGWLADARLPCAAPRPRVREHRRQPRRDRPRSTTRSTRRRASPTPPARSVRCSR